MARVEGAEIEATIGIHADGAFCMISNVFPVSKKEVRFFRNLNAPADLD